MNAVTIAQKITNGISCIVIVVFSVAPNTTTSHYKTFGVSSLAQYLWLAMFAAIERAAFLTLHFQLSKVRCTDPVLGSIVGARSFDLDALATVVANGNPNGL